MTDGTSPNQPIKEPPTPSGIISNSMRMSAMPSPAYRYTFAQKLTFLA